MKIIIAPDSFKGTFTAPEAAGLIVEGFRTIFPDADLIPVPVADGGEGTLDALLAGMSGFIVDTEVKNPLGDLRPARFGISGDGNTAIIEMAEAAGLELLEIEERNPLRTTTYGVGELILHAIRRSVSRIIMGVGGSATVDGGCGAAQALGVAFFDISGNPLPVPFQGGFLESIEALDLSDRIIKPETISLQVACDVDNPLTGPFGAARIFGPQKGADPAAVSILERGLEHLCRVIERDTGTSVGAIPGGGAAGGLAGGLAAFLGADLVNGFQLVAGVIGFEEHLKDASLVVTGEGKFDTQTLMGKAPAGVIKTAGARGIPVIVVAGSRGKLDVPTVIPVQRIFTTRGEINSAVEMDLTSHVNALINTAVRAADWCRTHIFKL